MAITFGENNRQGRSRGVMILTKKGLHVKEICNETTQEELIAVEVTSTDGTGIVVYIPPLTSARSREEHNELADKTIKSLERLLQRIEKNSNKLILTGDFNSTINWESLKQELRKILGVTNC